jgi:hypothetical protein
MNAHILVCPFDEGLVGRFERKAVVVRTDSLSAIPHISREVNRRNKLHCIRVDLDEPLSSISFEEDWTDTPISLFLPRLGAFREFADKLDVTKRMSLRVFLSTDFSENCTSLRILASLGVHCGVVFGKKPVDWELLGELAHYAIYGRAPHATIEPFQYIASQYVPKEFTDFGSVYFDNPARYLHIDAMGRLALTHEKLAAGDFVSESLDDVESIEENEQYKKHLKSWQTFFLRDSVCACCPAWRVCLGKFVPGGGDAPGCRQCFADLMDAAEFHQNSTKKTDMLCQL